MCCVVFVFVYVSVLWFLGSSRAVAGAGMGMSACCMHGEGLCVLSGPTCSSERQPGASAAAWRERHASVVSCVERNERQRATH